MLSSVTSMAQFWSPTVLIVNRKHFAISVRVCNNQYKADGYWIKPSKKNSLRLAAKEAARDELLDFEDYDLGAERTLCRLESIL